MKRILWLTLLIVLISISVPVFAQQQITFDIVQVQFWPEFDRPSMLVITSIELPEDTVLPVEVSVQIPADVGEPNAVAVAKDDQLLTAEYTREVVGEWAEIVVTADSPFLHIEYYDLDLSFDNFERTFDYSWVSDYAVNELIVRVQVPTGVPKMNFSAEMGFPELANDGLSYYLGNFGPLAAGEQFDFSLDYQKSSNILTVDALSNQNNVADPAAEENSGWLSDAPAWVWLLVGAGVILIALGAWFLVKDSLGSSKRKKPKYKQRKRTPASSKTNKKASKFCHQCGTSALSGDKFCRECGEKLRV
jgi:hypothetical protein